ncbi:MAG: hypothetical protein OQK12_15355 [Motiliproteus sp.]|nr:hypothetical protein [Motiliproteus sp.]MCW9054204.1 hypothetical protein [Motiliproteus sp.]
MTVPTKETNLEQPSVQDVNALLQQASSMRSGRLVDDMAVVGGKLTAVVYRLFSMECPVLLSTTMQGMLPPMVKVSGRQ